MNEIWDFFKFFFVFYKEEEEKKRVIFYEGLHTQNRRMAVASNELQLMMEHPEMVGKPVRVPVLILANKCDLENAIPADQV